MFLVFPLINRLQSIEGWLDHEEADLLINTTIKACIDMPSPHSIVEVGSYHGKSTVLLGSVVKHFFPKSKVYAIDPHEGIVGASDQGIQLLPSSLVMFNRNIANALLTDVVELMKDCSFNVKWHQPISLLFIDGLHDYENVSRDFFHFSEFVKLKGYVAFHDYAEYYPGVMIFVNELLSTNSYLKVHHIKSLIVLQRLH